MSLAVFPDVTPTETTEACAFYKTVLECLTSAKVPFAVCGAFALAHFTGIHRRTKDLDLMLKRADVDRALEVLAAAGHRAELTFSHWLAKVHASEDPNSDTVDLIFNSGNGVAVVDADFFRNGPEQTLFGQRVYVCPLEEIIWTKAFVMERERYDGADIAHLLHRCGDKIDWERLLRRFGAHWRLLFAHVTLLGYIYPDEDTRVPAWVLREFSLRLRTEARRRSLDAPGASRASPSGAPVCGGTLLSRQQFLVDVESWGYVDGRLAAGVMSEDEIEAWTRAIDQGP